MSERIYRDSVHNIIRLETGSREGKLLVALIDTPEFQRLRRIRQLGLAHFAYQGAEHSRFTHSLGVMHLATRILTKLAAKHALTKIDCTAVRVAALLHDIGHGAFSHVVEPILNFHHENYSIEAVLSDETEVGRLLRKFSAELPRMVASIIRGDFSPVALAQLVSSQLDADRMDYLLRDSLMTGAKYGIFDLEWIIKSIDIDTENDRLFVSARGVYAVEDYLQARYYMFRQVYFHRTLRSAEAVLRSILLRAVELYRVDGEVWFARGSAFEKLLSGKTLDLNEHLQIDDYDLVFHIKQWLRSKDEVLSDLAGRFLNRRLFKVFDLDMPEAEHRRFIDEVRSVVQKAGFKPEYYFAEDSSGDVPYFFYTKDSDESKNLIFVEDGYANPKIREISEISAPVRGLQKAIKIERICFPHEVKEEVAKLYHN